MTTIAMYEKNAVLNMRLLSFMSPCCSAIVRNRLTEIEILFEIRLTY